MTGDIRSEAAGGTLTLVIDRPDKKNALTDAMYATLADALERADGDPAVRVVLIRGEGTGFTAGNDLGEFLAVASGRQEFTNVVRFLRALAAFSKPLVAAVQGRAVGIGLTMLLHCDHVVLAADALLSAPFASLALVPEAASSLLLPALVGHQRAFAIFALGEEIGAEQALAWGLANAVVPPADLLDAAASAARRLAALPAGALGATKRLMRSAGVLVARMDLETEQFRARLATPEAREAFHAFAERRPPDFTGFS